MSTTTTPSTDLPDVGSLLVGLHTIAAAFGIVSDSTKVVKIVSDEAGGKDNLAHRLGAQHVSASARLMQVIQDPAFIQDLETLVTTYGAIALCVRDHGALAVKVDR